MPTSPYFSHPFVARRSEGRFGKARSDFPAGLYESILSKGKYGRNEAGVARSKSQQKGCEKYGQSEKRGREKRKTRSGGPERASWFLGVSSAGKTV